jgi:hypothetical protein
LLFCFSFYYFFLVILYTVVVVMKWLPVLGRQLCKLRLPYFPRGLFDTRDWDGVENMLAAFLLSLLHFIGGVFGECLAMAKDSNAN